VVLAGGGTGGHIYPLLAFADCLRRHDAGLRITCVGTPRGLEKDLIPAAGYDLRMVPAYQLPRSVNWNLVRTPDRMWTASRATRQILDEVSADAVVGFGGYVAVPAYLAAWRRKTPLLIHEKDVPVGVANRLGLRLTPHVGLGFPHQLTQEPLSLVTIAFAGRLTAKAAVSLSSTVKEPWQLWNPGALARMVTVCEPSSSPSSTT